MIKELSLTRWKSFEAAKIFIDPLTVLIGANAGGKSNALDSLRFLQRTAQGKDLTSSVAGDMGTPGLRGGIEWAALRPHTSFQLEVVVASDDAQTDYLYAIEVETKGKCELASESLSRLKYRAKSRANPHQLKLFWTDPVLLGTPSITARLYNTKRGTPKALNRSMSVLGQIASLQLKQEIADGVEQVVKALRSIFVLDAIPAHMRDYSPLSDSLQPDASNIAGVLAALPATEKAQLEATLTEYAKHVPERDIIKIWAEPVGKFNSDAMLYCDESWTNSLQPSTVDARGMSDGTLRFLAVLTALLTRPEKSLLVVEEVDNGLHPSRSRLLLRMLRETGAKRHIDVLVTTHNPALLDALGPEMVPFVLVAHRDPVSGFSRLTLIEELNDLPKMLATGPLGKLSADGRIQEAVARLGSPSHA